MAATVFVRAGIDKTLKDEAAAVLADMGLTVSDLVRIVLTRVAKDEALPFDMRISNKLTAKTLTQSEQGVDVRLAKNADDLYGQVSI